MGGDLPGAVHVRLAGRLWKMETCDSENCAAGDVTEWLGFQSRNDRAPHSTEGERDSKQLASIQTAVVRAVESQFAIPARYALRQESGWPLEELRLKVKKQRE
jgi:hypothetical protein